MSAQDYEHLRTAAGRVPYTNAGYAPVFIGNNGVPYYLPHIPARSPALDSPSIVAPGTGLRFDQLWSAHQNRVVLQPSSQFALALSGGNAPTRWPGNRVAIPRTFDPNMGALGGTRQRGFWQDQNRKTGLLHLNPLWALRTLNSVRTVTPKLNRMNAASGVPGVFLPTSASNFYHGRASY